jgi:hypothetical protein
VKILDGKGNRINTGSSLWAENERKWAKIGKNRKKSNFFKMYILAQKRVKTDSLAILERFKPFYRFLEMW